MTLRAEPDYGVVQPPPAFILWTQIADISACVTLRAEPDYDTGQPTPAFMPWTQIADIWLQRAGFLPTQRVHFAFDHRNCCLTI